LHLEAYIFKTLTYVDFWGENKIVWLCVLPRVIMGRQTSRCIFVGVFVGVLSLTNAYHDPFINFFSVYCWVLLCADYRCLSVISTRRESVTVSGFGGWKRVANQSTGPEELSFGFGPFGLQKPGQGMVVHLISRVMVV